MARTDPALGCEGAVLLLEEVSPAVCEIDSSSGALGNATHSLVETPRAHHRCCTRRHCADAGEVARPAFQRVPEGRPTLHRVPGCRDTLNVTVAHDYCWRWTNKGSAPVNLTIDLAR